MKRTKLIVLVLGLVTIIAVSGLVLGLRVQHINQIKSRYYELNAKDSHNVTIEARQVMAVGELVKVLNAVVPDYKRFENDVKDMTAWLEKDMTAWLENLKEVGSFGAWLEAWQQINENVELSKQGKPNWQEADGLRSDGKRYFEEWKKLADIYGKDTKLHERRKTELEKEVSSWRLYLLGLAETETHLSEVEKLVEKETGELEKMEKLIPPIQAISTKISAKNRLLKDLLARFEANLAKLKQTP